MDEKWVKMIFPDHGVNGKVVDKGAVFFNPGYPVGANFKGYKNFDGKINGYENIRNKIKG